MSVESDLLRRAADRLDTVVQDATAGPWYATNCEPSAKQGRVLGNYTVVHGEGQEVALVRGGWRSPDEPLPDAVFMATMHPVVATLLAEWLRVFADCVTDSPDTLDQAAAEVDSAVAVAREILGQL